MRTREPAARDPLLLGLCLALVGLLCLAQIRGSTLFIALLLAAFLALTLLAAARRRTLAMFLFFLPWSPLLKLYQGGVSFFTVALLLACAVHFVRADWRVRPYQIFCTAALAVLTLTAKAVWGESLSMSYLFFFAMLLLAPSLNEREAHDCSFFELTAYFSLGVISAALIAHRIATYPRISQFVTVDSYLTITRLSGFYGDPNFYSAHITAAFAGVQLLLVREKNGLARLGLALLAVALVYCGLLSASKSFVVVLACLFFVWVPLLLERSSGASTRLRVLLGAVVAGAVMLSSDAVGELLRVIDTRFSYAENVAQLTTGRTLLWQMYAGELLQDPLTLLLGRGYTPSALINGRASHNTILQGVFQLGAIGFPVLLVWQGSRLRHALPRAGQRDGWAAVLLLTGVALPWLGLDILFFDEWFLLPLYAVLGLAEDAALAEPEDAEKLQKVS